MLACQYLLNVVTEIDSLIPISSFAPPTTPSSIKGIPDLLINSMASVLFSGDIEIIMFFYTYIYFF